MSRPDDDAVYAQIDAANHGGPPKWPGMSYENGVESALRWALGDSDEPPIESEDDEA